MPRKPSVPRHKTGADELTESQCAYLALGWCLNPEPGDIGYWISRGPKLREWVPFAQEEDIRHAWLKYRKQVIALAREEERIIPEAWWWFESPCPEGKQQISGPDPLKPIRLTRGVPTMWSSWEDWKAAVFEPDTAFLARLGISQTTLRRKS